MDPEAIGKAFLAVITPVATLVGLGSRRHRLRREIRENLALIRELHADDVLREHTPAAGWLQGRVAVDVARLAGHPLGTPKKPINWGSVVFAALIGVLFGGWTLHILRDGFAWYSVFPGLVAFLMVISIIGMTTDRELPPDQTGDLPPGATPIRANGVEERITTSVSIAAGGGGDFDGRFEPTGQIGAVFEFFAAMGEGRYEDGLRFADERWITCRLQSWLWNNRSGFGEDLDTLQALADSLQQTREPATVWEDFVASEAATFKEVWGTLDPSTYGAASRRRRLSEDHDLVILAPVGNSGGYFVTSATALTNALVFVVHRQDHRWLVANHLGSAPPQPGWPPIWWATADPAVDALPDP